MSDQGPTLHVLTPPRPLRAGVPAGELLCTAVAADADPRDRALIFGTSRDRDAAEALGVRRPWLARRPAGPGAARLVATTIRRAALRLAEDATSDTPATVALWSAELRAIRARLRRLTVTDPLRDRDLTPDDLAAAALDRLPARDAAREHLALGDALTLAPLAASPRHADARALAFVSGVLDLLGHRHTLLLPDQAQRLDEGLRFIRQTELATRVVLIGPPLLAALPAADVLIEPVRTAPGTDALPTDALRALARRLGVPIASTAGWDTNAGLGHGILPPEIRATVGPAVDAVLARRADPAAASLR